MEKPVLDMLRLEDYSYPFVLVGVDHNTHLNWT